MSATRDAVLDVLRSAGYSTTHSNANDWVAYVERVGLQAGLQELNRSMPNTNISAYVSQSQPQQQQQVAQQQPQQQAAQQTSQNLDNRTVLEQVMRSAGYNTSQLDGWTNYANSVGLEKALQEFAAKNPGAGGKTTNISPYLVSQQTTEQQRQAALLEQQRQAALLEQQRQAAQQQEYRAALERAMKSGNYNTEKIDEWTDYAMREGIEKALTEFQKNNPGSGSAITNISRDLGQASAQRILSQMPNTGLSGISAAIPELNLANLYPQAPTFATNKVEPMQLRQATGLPALVAQPNVIPQLNPAIQFINTGAGVEGQPSTFFQAQTPVTETATMAGGGVVNYQKGGRTPLSPQEVGSTFDVSEYINPETGRFYINEFERDVVFNPELREAERVARERMTPEEEAFAIEQMRGRFGLPGAMRFVRPYAEGGVASLSQDLASRGRHGDSMLVHMAPEEVAGLQSLAQQMGGSLTINPETGLPEAKSLRKLLPYLAAVLAAPYIGPGAAALAAGAGTAIGSGSLKEGIKVGLGAYGVNLATAGMMGSNPLGAGGQESTFNLANTFKGAPAKVGTGAGGVDVTGGNILAGGDPVVDALQNAPQTTQIQAPPPTVQAATAQKAAGGTKIFGMDPSTALMAGTLLAGGSEASKEQERFAQQQREAAEEERRRRGLGYAAYERSGLANIPMGAGGGIVALARGGMPTFEYGGTTAPTGEPRMVQGAGDGMSDNVPASIEGVQEARLANDEFVVPADVVADIGNGSSNAGAKKLYAMMDRIRKARHGTTEQPPEIDAERLMPA